MSLKIITIVGARPQFVKAAVISRAFQQKSGIDEIIVHTGQHYDANMSDIFFSELQIPKPAYNLEVGSGSHGQQTGRMLELIEQVLIQEKPNMVLVYGDTNSTVAGSLAAAKLHVPVAHVEAGLRSFNRTMPEEINRIATDHISDYLFAPTQNAMNLLAAEGLAGKSFFTGDVMFDSVIYYLKKANEIDFKPPFADYYLATLHRQENTDNPGRLKEIFVAFSKLDKPIVLPLHPRTKKMLGSIQIDSNINIIEPVGYLEMLNLLNHSHRVLTDSGGLQKEAFILQKPCITLRDETEWIETLEDGWNHVVGTNTQLIMEKSILPKPVHQSSPFGDGRAGYKIVDLIFTNCK
jgi:UDP-GlcNAc3NAcA epimerase